MSTNPTLPILNFCISFLSNLSVWEQDVCDDIEMGPGVANHSIQAPTVVCGWKLSQ